MRSGRVLIISENAPVPADRRVWNISRTLTAVAEAVRVRVAEIQKSLPAGVTLRVSVWVSTSSTIETSPSAS